MRLWLEHFDRTVRPAGRLYRYTAVGLRGGMVRWEWLASLLIASLGALCFLTIVVHELDVRRRLQRPEVEAPKPRPQPTERSG